MKYIFLNLKRFDIPKQLGGVNSIAPAEDWAGCITRSVRTELAGYGDEAEFAVFFPEAHILSAAREGTGNLRLGCQGVHREDVAPGGNFGAFTTMRTAKSMRAIGCDWTIIGHCEERRELHALADAFGGDHSVVDTLLNAEVLSAQAAGLKVLFCVGENTEETDRRGQVLRTQLTAGLRGADLDRVVIGYEPLWAIGPGRPVPSAEDISAAAGCIKDIVTCPVVYGGGLKQANAGMLASVPEIDGGLIALTRFSGDIGFYPDEYLEIIRLYLGRGES